MVRLNESARRNLLWRSIMAILGLKARTPYVISSTSYRRYCSLNQNLITSGMIKKWIFNADLARMLRHNKFILVGLLSLNIALSNALTTINLRPFNSEVLKAFEHPLKIMLMLLGIVVENSKQYGSKWHKLFFQIVWKSPESVLLGRATHHSIRNASNFLTHIHMSSSEDACILYLRIHLPPFYQFKSALLYVQC